MKAGTSPAAPREQSSPIDAGIAQTQIRILDYLLKRYDGDPLSAWRRIFRRARNFGWIAAPSWSTIIWGAALSPA